MWREVTLAKINPKLILDLFIEAMNIKVYWRMRKVMFLLGSVRFKVVNAISFISPQAVRRSHGIHQ